VSPSYCSLQIASFLQNSLDERRATTCPVGRERIAGLI
jgi:hypothetical protein